MSMTDPEFQALLDRIVGHHLSEMEDMKPEDMWAYTDACVGAAAGLAANQVYTLSEGDVGFVLRMKVDHVERFGKAWEDNLAKHTNLAKGIN